METENFKKYIRPFSYDFYYNIFHICEFFNSNYKIISETLRNCKELTYLSVFLNIHLNKEGELCVNTIGPSTINFVFKTYGGDKHSLTIMSELRTFDGLDYNKMSINTYLVKVDSDNVTNTVLSLNIFENQFEPKNETLIILNDMIQFNMFTKILRSSFTDLINQIKNYAYNINKMKEEVLKTKD